MEKESECDNDDRNPAMKDTEIVLYTAPIMDQADIMEGINNEFALADESNLADEIVEQDGAIATTPVVDREPINQIPYVVEEFKPVVGMSFDDLKTGIQFYRKYSEHAGFNMRLDIQKGSKGNVIYRRCVCNKAGLSKPTGKKRRVAITRVGCQAKIVFKRIEEGVGEAKIVKYKVATFIESHSHHLNTPNTMVHMKQAREISIVHKKMIIDNSKINLGATKSFKMFKEHVSGFSNIGASLEDFKNFSRDVKKFIKEYDAQMLIEKFMQKKTMCSAFYFDFDVDKDGNLSRLFWADPIAIKNYMLFGDPVSFDTTFNKNQYKMVFGPFTGIDNHKKCVIFGACLLSHENTESFVWVFENFLKAMGGRYPNFIITDQDPAIKAAVERVFGDKTKHKFCVWHIMKKVTDKVSSDTCKDTNFLKDINACVWGDDVEVDDFEQKWVSMISTYELENNEWLDNMKKLCAYWIPAYFRDLFLGGLMRTTSRSESENSFFANFTNPNLSLVEFYMRYESAIDSQRWKHSKLVADSKNSSPQLSTELEMERHASKIYTPVIFYEFQQELKAACFRCGLKDRSTDGVGKTIFITDREKHKEYRVQFLITERKVVCSCKKFIREGILCRHAIYVLKDEGFDEVPKEYLLDRWMKNATCQPVFSVDGTLLVDCSTLDTKNKKIGELYTEAFVCVSLVENNEEKADELLKLLRDFRENVTDENEGCENRKRKRGKKDDDIEKLLGTKIPEEVTVLPPKQSKTKGSGRSGRRVISEKEKAIEEQKRDPRKCKYCLKMAYHDYRNCPERQQQKDLPKDATNNETA